MSDNGGAIAIKGFNYQKAAIMLVMINNYQKQNFKVIPESREDFEVHVGSEIYFIQVKGTNKLSISSLTRREQKGSIVAKSIVEKNLVPGTDNNKRKIFVHSLAESTKKDLVSENGTIVTPVYALSDEQRETIINNLDLNESQKLRLQNQKIYITPFGNDLTLALKQLKGEMVEKDLLVTKKRANLILGELAQEIDTKSEIEVHNDNDVQRKIIDSEFLNEVFVSVQKKEMFDSVLNSLQYNHIRKIRIGLEKTKILLNYQSLKKEMKSIIDVSQLMGMSDEEIINFIVEEIKKTDDTIENEELIIAIAIDCYCEIGDELK